MKSNGSDKNSHAHSFAAGTSQFYVHCPFHKRRCKCSARQRDVPQLSKQMPTSKDSHLRGKFLSVASFISGDEDWYGFVLPRIGCDSGLDQATIAVTKAYRQPGPVALRGQAQYTRSLKALQSACNEGNISNSDLLTVTLCFLYEVRATTTGSSPHIHGDGIAAMLTSKAPADWTGNVACSIFYTLSTLVFHNSVQLGKPNPFDDGVWYKLTPTTQFSPHGCIRRIRHLAQILLIRLPLLILHVREYCHYGDSGSRTSDSVKLTAQELLAVCDGKAEQDCLNMLELCETKEEALTSFYNRSYVFRGVHHFQTLTLWWTTRLLLLRLCAKIASHTSDTGHEWYSSLTQHQTTCDAAKRDMCDHVMRSLQYTKSINMMSRWPYLLAIQPVYGAVAEPEDPTEQEYRYAMRTTLVAWHAWFLRSMDMEEQNEAVLSYLSEALNGGVLRPPIP